MEDGRVLTSDLGFRVEDIPPPSRFSCGTAARTLTCLCGWARRLLRVSALVRISMLSQMKHT